MGLVQFPLLIDVGVKLIAVGADEAGIYHEIVEVHPLDLLTLLFLGGARGGRLGDVCASGTLGELGCLGMWVVAA